MLTWASPRSSQRRVRVRPLLGVGAAFAAIAFVLFGGQSSTDGDRAFDGSASGNETAGLTVAGTVVERPGGPTGAARSGPEVPPLADSTGAGAADRAGRTVGSLPDIAARPVPAPVGTELPSSQTAALPAWRLRTPVAYASGAIKARPLPRSVSPIRRRSAITAIATKLAAQQFGGSLRPADVDTFFAEFDAPVGEWLGKVESVETEPRSAWFVVFSGMESSRSTGVVTRRRDAAHPPSTVSLRVISDVVVVIDDDTGEVLVASEFLSETTPSAR